MRLLELPLVTEPAPVVAVQTEARPAEPVQASYRAPREAADRTIAPATPAVGYPYTTTTEPASRTPVTKADVIAWTARGVPDDVIIERLTRSRSTFQLTAADQNELRDQGVSKSVVRAMREMWRR